MDEGEHSSLPTSLLCTPAVGRSSHKVPAPGGEGLGRGKPLHCAIRDAFILVEDYCQLKIDLIATCWYLLQS